MSPSMLRTTARATTAGVAAAAAAYAAYAAATWCSFGRVARATDAYDEDDLLDRFIPIYDVVERHRIRVAAPADLTLAAACEQDLFGLPLVRAIVKAREIVMGAEASPPQPRGLLAATQAIGWGILAERQGREIVVGAVTKPWEANVTFHALPAGEFAAFAEPGYVKIVWTLRAEPLDGQTSLFLTQTRAAATDADARARFRVYWAFASPGIALIRRLSLRPLRREAERRARPVNAPATAQALAAESPARPLP